MITKRLLLVLSFLGLTLILGAGQIAGADALRQVVSLNGIWQIGEGSVTTPPAVFEHTVPVPGLVDQANPAFQEVGVKSTHREAFWYRRTFFVDQAIPAVAQLKLHKAMFGSRVILNGKDLGEHRPSFTPGYFNLKDALRQGTNELVIRVGAFPTNGTKSIGWDQEKAKYIPGIFDSIEMIFTGAPHLDHIQAVPDLAKQAVTVHTWPAGPVHVTIREHKSQQIVGAADGTGPLTVPIAGCRLWTPEDPFLYELSVRTSGDEIVTRFGMRGFRLDPETGRAILNGKPYFMRGSNVTLYRFFEDAARGALPWDEEWVRKLHRRFKEMHWNSLRYCIGFPPEFWYRIADEEGFLIQDEFPIWMPFVKPGEINASELAEQYREWMQERWNHPCVVIWDACNETDLPETENAYTQVRALDLSSRPWDNGWRKPATNTDCCELHPYHFNDPYNTIEVLGHDPGTLARKPGESPIINNEYGWLWLNRDGTPTKVTRKLYNNLLGTNSTTYERRMLSVRYLAAETEFWRARRGCAAVLHFCALGYSRPGGITSDHWLDVKQLEFEPLFYQYVRDAFAPVAVMIDDFKPIHVTSQSTDFPLLVMNDLDSPWKGQVRVELIQGDRILSEDCLPVEVAAYGTTQLPFKTGLPSQAGAYQLKATLLKTPVGDVSSLRDFSLLTPEQMLARNGIAVGKPATASSFGQKPAPSFAMKPNRFGAQMEGFLPEAAVDGSLITHWEPNALQPDPQWLAVDLQSSCRVARIQMAWKKGYAKSYAIQVSSDGQAWTDVYKTDAGKGGVETVSFAPVTARWVRFYGTQRADKASGYQLCEFRVFTQQRFHPARRDIQIPTCD